MSKALFSSECLGSLKPWCVWGVVKISLLLGVMEGSFRGPIGRGPLGGRVCKLYEKFKTTKKLARHSSFDLLWSSQKTSCVVGLFSCGLEKFQLTSCEKSKRL